MNESQELIYIWLITFNLQYKEYFDVINKLKNKLLYILDDYFILH